MIQLKNCYHHDTTEKIVLTMIQLKNCYHHDTTEKKILTMIQLKNCSLTILLKKKKKKNIYIFFRYLSNSKYKQVTFQSIDSQQITATSAVNGFYSCILLQKYTCMTQNN